MAPASYLASHERIEVWNLQSTKVYQTVVQDYGDGGPDGRPPKSDLSPGVIAGIAIAAFFATLGEHKSVPLSLRTFSQMLALQPDLTGSPSHSRRTHKPICRSRQSAKVRRNGHLR